MQGQKVWAIGLLAAMSVTTVACGGEQECRERPSQQEVERKIIGNVYGTLDDIDASDAQQKTIVSMVKAQFPEGRKVAAKRKQQRLALMDEFLKKSPSVKQVHANINASSATMLGFAQTMTEVALKAHPVLNKEQRAELAEELEERKQRKIQDSWMARRVLGNVLDELEATKEQRKLVDAKKASLIKEANQTMSRVFKIRAQLIAQLRANRPDAKLTVKLVDKAGVEMTSFAHSAVDDVWQLHQTLSGAQRKKADSFLAFQRKCAAR